MNDDATTPATPQGQPTCTPPKYYMPFTPTVTGGCQGGKQPHGNGGCNSQCYGHGGSWAYYDSDIGCFRDEVKARAELKARGQYDLVGQGSCRDSQGKYTNHYVKKEVTSAACETQCSSDCLCTHYDYDVDVSQCAIFAPKASSAPGGWSYVSGNGAQSITAVNQEGGATCNVKKAA